MSYKHVHIRMYVRTCMYVCMYVRTYISGTIVQCVDILTAVY